MSIYLKQKNEKKRKNENRKRPELNIIRNYYNNICKKLDRIFDESIVDEAVARIQKEQTTTNKSGEIGQ